MIGDDQPAMTLTGEQATVIVGLERAGASLSMVGVLLIIATFTLFKRLRTVPNTFILFASIANIGASTASLIGLAGIAEGSDSSLCRAQAFLLEMFMQSDPWWSFAMAFNVYLVFFHSANPTTFRHHLWVYCLICFGVPMIPAVVCLVVQTSAKGPIYGDATLWCWIGNKWNSLRIFTYYIPIWICIFFSAVIYVAVGYHVFHQRNQLRNLTLSNQANDLSGSEVRDSAEKNLSRRPEIYGTVTTDIQVTSNFREPVLAMDHTPPMTPAGSPMQCPWSNDPFEIHSLDAGSKSGPASRQHHSIEEELGAVLPAPPAVYGATGGMYNGHSAVYPATSTTIVSSLPLQSAPFHPDTRSRYLSHERDQSEQPQLRDNLAKASHLPPLSHASTSRTRQSQHVEHARGTCTVSVAVQHIDQRTHSRSLSKRVRRAWHRFAGKLRRLDPVKLAYLRTSFVFAISVLVTWTPSSINRVYALIYPARMSYGLNIASAAVLPLQGVWNAVIYFSTSWALLREETLRWSARSRWLRRLRGSSARIHSDGHEMSERISERTGERMRMPGHSGDGMAAAGPNLGSGLVSVRSRAGSFSRVGTSGFSGRTAFGHANAGCSNRPDLHASCFDDEDDTETDSLDDRPSAISSHRLRPTVNMDIEACPRSPTRPGTLRVQRGGHFDA